MSRGEVNDIHPAFMKQAQLRGQQTAQAGRDTRGLRVG
jgi:hypothetical protein